MTIARLNLAARLASGELPPRMGTGPSTPLAPCDPTREAWVVQRTACLRALRPAERLLTLVTMAEADWEVATRT